MQENIKKRSIGTKGKITGSSNIDKEVKVENIAVQGEETLEEQGDAQIKRIKLSDNALPDDFFDNSSKTSSIQQEKTTNEIEEEWVLFQKLISKETQVSNQIAYEDEEELQRDRDEMLEREQEMCIQRSERLKEVAKKVRESREQKMLDVVDKKDNDGSDDDDDDEDIDDDFENEWMDWRAQRIL